MVELADTLDLGSGAERRESSNLSRRTNFDFLREPPWTPDALEFIQSTLALADKAAIHDAQAFLASWWDKLER